MEKSNLVGSMLSSALTSSFTPSSYNAPFPISSFTYRKPTSSSLTASSVSGSSCLGLSRSKSSQVTSQPKYQAKVASQQSQYVSLASSYGSQQPVYSASVTASGNTFPSQMGYSSRAGTSYCSNNTGNSNQRNVYSRSTETATQGSMLRSKAASTRSVKKASKHSVKKAPKRSVKTSKRSVKKASKQSVKKASKQSVKKASKQSVKKASKRIVKKASKRSVKMAAKQNAEAAVKQSAKAAAKQSAQTSSFISSSLDASYPISSYTSQKLTNSSVTCSTVGGYSCSGLFGSASSQGTSQSKYQHQVASQQSQYVCSASSYDSQQLAYSALMTASENTHPSQMGSMLSSKAAAEQSALTSSFTSSYLNAPFSYTSQILTSSSLIPSTVSVYSCSGLLGSASTQGTSQSKYQARVASQQSQYVCSASSYGSQQPGYSALVTASGNTHPSQLGYSFHATGSYSSNNTGYRNQQNVYSGSTETTTQGSALRSQARVINCVLPSFLPFPCSHFNTSCLAPSTVSGERSLVDMAQVPSLQPQYVSSASSYGLQQSACLASVTTSGDTYPLQTDPCLDSSEDSQDSFSTELQTIFIKKLAEEESVSDFNQEEDKQTEESLNDLGDQSVTSKKDEDKHFNQEEDRQAGESLNDWDDQSVTSKKDEDKHMEFYHQQMEEEGTSEAVVDIFL